MNLLLVAAGLGVFVALASRRQPTVAPGITQTPQRSGSSPASSSSSSSSSGPTTITREQLRGSTSGKIWNLSTVKGPSGIHGDVSAPADQWPGLTDQLFVLRFAVVNNKRILTVKGPTAPAAIVQAAMVDFNVKAP